MEFLSNNWELLAGVIVAVVAALLGQRRLVWFRWFNDVAFYAWEQAEKYGLFYKWSGRDKLAHYLNVWKAKYQEKFGQPAPDAVLEQARQKAAELSLKDKVMRLTDPLSSVNKLGRSQ